VRLEKEARFEKKQIFPLKQEIDEIDFLEKISVIKNPKLFLDTPLELPNYYEELNRYEVKF